MVRVGDRVAPSGNMAGTWNTHSELSQGNFVVVGSLDRHSNVTDLILRFARAFFYYVGGGRGDDLKCELPGF